jgi:hypothetical protein
MNSKQFSVFAQRPKRRARMLLAGGACRQNMAIGMLSIKAEAV